MMSQPRSTPVSHRQRILAAGTPAEVERLLEEGLAFKLATWRSKARMRQAAKTRIEQLESES